jgi:XrtJ-associated TM-motif-TM protein
MFMKKFSLFAALALVMFAAKPAHAQSGCDDTPENPTLILGGLASGVFAVNSLRTRYRASRAPKK